MAECVSSAQTLSFQIIASDFYISTDAQPVIRLYGRTATGLSVCCKVHGCFPYIYVKVPDWFTKEDCLQLQTYLNKKIRISPDEFLVTPLAIQSIELVTKSSIFHPKHPLFQNKEEQFAKIFYTMPSVVHSLTAHLLRGFDVVRNEEKVKLSCYEPRLDFITSFFIDKDFDGCGWIHISSDKFSLSERKDSLCNLEVNTSIEDVKKSPSLNCCSAPAPFNILSFDIECLSSESTFANPDSDQIIQISNIIFLLDETMSVLTQNVFTIGSCTAIENCNLLSFDEESDLLIGWQQFLIEHDPDILLGYNVNNFDLWYILERSRKLNIENSVTCLGRLRNVQSKIVQLEYYQEQMNRFTDRKEFNLEGRVILDLYVYIRNNYSLPSYKLNNVSKHFLGQQKLDVHYSEIRDLHQGDMFSRKKLAEYCLRDSQLIIYLIQKLNVIPKCIQLANVTGLCLQRLIFQGLELKVLSVLFRKIRSQNQLLPVIKNIDSEVEYVSISKTRCTIVNPLPCFFQQPIVVLKIPLLFAAVLTTSNICFSTLLKAKETSKLTTYEYVKPNVHRGVLPLIFSNYFTEIKQIKIRLQSNLDPHVERILIARMNALKTNVNDICRFFQGNNGIISCSSISKTVLSASWQLIKTVKNCIDIYLTQTKRLKDAKIVSANDKFFMIDFGLVDITKAYELGNELAELINQNLSLPVIIELKRIYSPILLINKMQFAGCIQEVEKASSGKLKVTGICTQFPQACKLVEITINHILMLLCQKSDIIGALNYIHVVVQNLKHNQIKMNDLILSKKLTQSDFNLSTQLKKVADRQKQFNKNQEAKVGDEVFYVVIKNEKNHNDMCIETPSYAIIHNLIIDADFYLEQLRYPINMLFYPICGYNLLN